MSDNDRQKIELSPTKDVSQQIKLPGVKLKLISYQCLKTQKHSVSVGLS